VLSNDVVSTKKVETLPDPTISVLKTGYYLYGGCEKRKEYWKQIKIENEEIK